LYGTHEEISLLPILCRENGASAALHRATPAGRHVAVLPSAERLPPPRKADLRDFLGGVSTCPQGAHPAPLAL